MNPEQIEKELELLNGKLVAVDINLYGGILLSMFGTLTFNYNEEIDEFSARVATEEMDISFNHNDILEIEKNTDSECPLVASIFLKRIWQYNK